MAGQEGSFLYVAVEKGADKAKIGITTNIERREASLGPKVTIRSYVETPWNEEWEELIKDLLENLAILSGKTGEGTASKDTEWFTVHPDRLEPLLLLIANEQGITDSAPETETGNDLTDAQKEVLELLREGMTYAEIDRHRGTKAAYGIARALEKKGYSW